MGGRPREAPPGRRAAFLRGRSGKPPAYRCVKEARAFACAPERGAHCVLARLPATWESRAFCLLPRPAAAPAIEQMN